MYVDMLASKAGSAKTSLKLLFKDDLPAGGLHFTFTSSSSKEDDRKVVQDTLIPFVSANRAGPSAPAPAAPAANGAVDAPAASAPGTPSAVVTGKRKAMDGDASPSTLAAGTPGATNGLAGAGKSGRPENWRLRVKVLKKNPNLDLLYRELVIGKQITEAEFWEGREVSVSCSSTLQTAIDSRSSRHCCALRNWPKPKNPADNRDCWTIDSLQLRQTRTSVEPELVSSKRAKKALR